uniref:Uncharacterized protein n=1 Tax=Anguilla anguilla TaxID=7936 RepID=A0A0E9RVL5_ANGAN
MNCTHTDMASGRDADSGVQVQERIPTCFIFSVSASLSIVVLDWRRDLTPGGCLRHLAGQQSCRTG